ncbi:MAG: 5-methyltetrahydropteroyltriglutamate--homocysteine S-methyltransferase [Candidatus Altiarchaeales archaeon]|nr:5-methyltetrahydropteroyltriglutamate--homocysteine S-methyltransferase [Candidatus Altiarchaeales archaeon]
MNVKSTTLGFSCMGPVRETKFAVEAFINGELDEKGLLKARDEVRVGVLKAHLDAGVDLIPSNIHSFYDFLLDECLMFNIIPKRFRGDYVEGDLGSYFRLAKACDMTRWFNTNYYVMVPEVSDDAEFCLVENRALEDFKYFLDEHGVETKPVLVGPVTLLSYAKIDSNKGFSELVVELSRQFAKALKQLEEAGAGYVEIDEPILVKNPELVGDVEAALKIMAGDLGELKICLHTYFGKVAGLYDKLLGLPCDLLGFDLIYDLRVLDKLRENPPVDKGVCLGVIDGRGVWKADLKKDYDQMSEVVSKLGEEVLLSTSSSLSYVPYSLGGEDFLEGKVRDLLAFGVEKLDELSMLKDALVSGDDSKVAQYSESVHGFRRAVENQKVRDRIAALCERDFERASPFSNRKRLQDEALGLPPLFTTTIGSFPQTKDIRKARRDYKKAQGDLAKKKISEKEFEKIRGGYMDFIHSQIKDYVSLQKELGLDVLVHGEPERSDMVEYFAQYLDGMATTVNGWVKSYGTRCVRPPIIYGDVSRPKPITVEWISYAQSLTDKPMKGMLTAPATIYNWCFTPNHIPAKDTLFQIGLSLRDEVSELEENGVKVIQLDDPALIERLPYVEGEKKKYLSDHIKAFRLSSSGVADETMIVTHMCYGDFKEIYPELLDMDADVYTFEFSKSGQDLYPQFSDPLFTHGLGVGVLDVHTPKVESVDEVKRRILQAISVFPKENVSINPDCGLKTRGLGETKGKLSNMVEAVKQVRLELGE